MGQGIFQHRLRPVRRRSFGYFRPRRIDTPRWHVRGTLMPAQANLAQHGLDHRPFLQERPQEPFRLGDVLGSRQRTQTQLALAAGMQGFGKQDAKFQRPPGAMLDLGVGKPVTQLRRRVFRISGTNHPAQPCDLRRQRIVGDEPARRQLRPVQRAFGERQLRQRLGRIAVCQVEPGALQARAGHRACHTQAVAIGFEFIQRLQGTLIVASFVGDARLDDVRRDQGVGQAYFLDQRRIGEQQALCSFALIAFIQDLGELDRRHGIADALGFGGGAVADDH